MSCADSSQFRHAVLIETLTGDAKNHDRAEGDLRSAYPWVPVPDDVWSVIGAVQKDLGAVSHHGLSVADHLVVATAIRLKLVVHEDADFETVARVVPQLREQRLTADG